MTKEAHTFDLARIGVGLPVAAASDQLALAAATGTMVISAPPGTGKTTFVPALVANLLAPDDRSSLGTVADGAASTNTIAASRTAIRTARPGTVLLTEPRRVAVRAAARRIAELDGTELGTAVGFTVRGERKVSPDTRIEVVTPGVLLRRLLTDPGLDGVAAVILDEVHERSLESDLLLGMLTEVRELRDDLLICSMSATLEIERVAEVVRATPQSVVQVPSALHPLTVSYEPYAKARLDSRGVTRGYLAHLADVTLRAVLQNDCDALVFLPGVREVDEVVRLLCAHESALQPGSAQPFEVLPLHGRISAKEQDRAVHGRAPHEPLRIVVSTSLAESSLTVPGVHLVIDSGLSREVRRDRARDMAGLVTVSASRASATQRAGRAARQAPGHALRVYSEADFAHMPAVSLPEISVADLTDAALLLSVWGTPGGKGLRLPTAPPQVAMHAAVRVLTELGLVGGQGRATPEGVRVAQLPIGAREARALISSSGVGVNPKATAEVIAAVSDDHREPGADLATLLRDLKFGRGPAAARWRKETKRLHRIIADELRGVSADAADAVDAIDAPGLIVALARPEWIAQRTGPHSRSYLLASGTRAALPEGSPLLGAEWIAVREVQRADGHAADGTGAVIRLAARLSETNARSVAAPLLRETRVARVEEGRVRVRAARWLGEILLSETNVSPQAGESAHAFRSHLHEAGLSALDWGDAALSLRSRLALLRHTLGDPWPSVDDQALLSLSAVWLDGALASLKPSDSLHRIDVVQALRSLLPWPQAARFDELVPQHLTVPSGSRVRIEYPAESGDGARPVVSVKLQEVFGLLASPRLVDGRIPVQFHLLSPARRPLAVTDDLTSFWAGPYRQVRAEMRGRYPKHPWPEDPLTAQATARTKRASGTLGESGASGAR